MNVTLKSEQEIVIQNLLSTLIINIFMRHRNLSTKKLFLIIFISFVTINLISFYIVCGTIQEIVLEREKRENYIKLQPLITQNAKFISKRTLYSKKSGTRYYITFEFLNKNRIEYPVEGKEYGLLAEGDKGELTTQAGEYKGFKRLLLP